jgi:hypothetical protein
VGGSTLTPVVYSKARRNRGDSPYTFAIASANWDGLQHWLSSRES